MPRRCIDSTNIFAAAPTLHQDEVRLAWPEAQAQLVEQLRQLFAALLHLRDVVAHECLVGEALLPDKRAATEFTLNGTLSRRR